MAKFRKKPIVIEAIQFIGGTENRMAVLDFTGIDALNAKTIYWRSGYWRSDDTVGELVIRTLEGDLIASPGDWIIRGVAGELYPIKNEIFRETYESLTREFEEVGNGPLQN